ncbi:unknown protein [Simkania negevensis Z]|uniref:Uncharacterized protein n=1 Tax=Simkania negevensis (strain ATCC VR-1471 / DSM 27360 / Z) TaxID=331113 RepID=F8L3P6_SIMNZ|nr:unknown protein [Simkania negevensis Z]
MRGFPYRGLEGACGASLRRRHFMCIREESRQPFPSPRKTQLLGHKLVSKTPFSYLFDAKLSICKNAKSKNLKKIGYKHPQKNRRKYLN